MTDVIYVPTDIINIELHSARIKLVKDLMKSGWTLVGHTQFIEKQQTVIAWVLERPVRA